MKKVLGTIILAILFINSSVSAQASQFRLGVEVMTGQHQRQGTSFYDLVLAPGQSSTERMIITNHSNEPVDVIVHYTNATTDNGGSARYGRRSDDFAQVESEFHVGDVLNGTREITIAGNQSYELNFTVTMPEQAFDGLLAFGIEVFEDVDLSEEEVDGAGIINTQSFAVPVIIRQNANQVESQLVLENARAHQRNFANVMAVDFVNPARRFINLMDVEARVYPANAEEPLFMTENTGMQMAPQSQFTFSIPLDRQPFAPGDYVFVANITSHEGDWEFSLPFTITAQEASAFNATDVTIYSVTNWSLIIAGSAILLAVIAVTIMAAKLKKKNKEVNYNV